MSKETALIPFVICNGRDRNQRDSRRCTLRLVTERLPCHTPCEGSADPHTSDNLTLSYHVQLEIGKVHDNCALKSCPTENDTEARRVQHLGAWALGLVRAWYCLTVLCRCHGIFFCRLLSCVQDAG